MADYIKKSWDNGVYIRRIDIWTQDNLTVNEKLVLMCLEKYSNDNSEYWPGISVLAKECSLSEKQVRRLIYGHGEGKNRTPGLIEKGFLGKRYLSFQIDEASKNE